MKVVAIAIAGIVGTAVAINLVQKLTLISDALDQVSLAAGF